MPVWFRRPPLPEIIGPLNVPAIVTSKRSRGFTSFRGGSWSVIERYLEENKLDYDHYEGLNEEGCIEACAWVVENSQHTGNQHNQWNIQREPSTRLRPMNRIRLVRITRYRGDDDEYWGYEASYEGHDAHLDGYGGYAVS